MMKKQYFEKKTFSSFKKASLPKWEGAKYAGGSRPSCFSLLAGLIQVLPSILAIPFGSLSVTFRPIRGRLFHFHISLISSFGSFTCHNNVSDITSNYVEMCDLITIS